VTVKKIADALDRFDWEGLFNGIDKFIDRMGGLIEAVGGAGNAFIIFAVLANASMIASLFTIIGTVGRLVAALWTLVGGLEGVGAIFAIITGPIGLIVGLIALFATGAYLLIKHWDKVKAWFSGFFDWIAKGFWSIVEIVLGVWRTIASVVPDFLGGDKLRANIDGMLAYANNKTGNTPLAQSGALAAAGTNVNGKIDVNFHNAPPGMRVSEGQTNQPGLEFNPDVGYRSFAFGS